MKWVRSSNSGAEGSPYPDTFLRVHYFHAEEDSRLVFPTNNLLLPALTTAQLVSDPLTGGMPSPSDQSAPIISFFNNRTSAQIPTSVDQSEY
jgi:hypothetical protein